MNDDDFDVQTKYPISETPDGSVKKLPKIPAKSIIAFFVIFFIVFFAYSFNEMQKEALNEYKENVKVLKENAVKNEDFEKNFDKDGWVEMFALRDTYRSRLNDNFLSYVLTLNLPKDLFNPVNENVKPKVFQVAQKDFLQILEEYKNYKEPDFSASISNNQENFKNLNKKIEEEINYILPLMKFAFEKASNADDLRTVLTTMLSNDINKESEGHKNTCEIIKTKIPEFKGIPC